MYKIRLVFLITISSLFLNCKAFEFDCKNEVKEYQWDAYIQAIQAAAPFLNQGKNLIVYGILQNYSNDNVPIELGTYYILTSDYKFYKRTPTMAYPIHKRSKFNSRDNRLRTELIDSIQIREIIKTDTTGMYKMFNPEEYIDCYITKHKSEQHDFYHYGYFYAMIDETGKVHGATSLLFGQKTPFSPNYAFWMDIFARMEYVFRRPISQSTKNVPTYRRLK